MCTRPARVTHAPGRPGLCMKWCRLGLNIMKVICHLKHNDIESQNSIVQTASSKKVLQKASMHRFVECPATSMPTARLRQHAQHCKKHSTPTAIPVPGCRCAPPPHPHLLKSETSSLRMVLQAFLTMSMGRPVKEKRRVRPRGYIMTHRAAVPWESCTKHSDAVVYLEYYMAGECVPELHHAMNMLGLAAASNLLFEP